MRLLLNYRLYPWALWPTASQWLGGHGPPGPPGSYAYDLTRAVLVSRSCSSVGPGVPRISTVRMLARAANDLYLIVLYYEVHSVTIIIATGEFS